MRGRKHNFYSALKENTHTTDMKYIDTLGENWKTFKTDDEYIYFVSEFGFLLSRNKETNERKYIFGKFEDNEFYVTIDGERETIANIVAKTFFKETRQYSKWTYLYKNRDPRDPSVKNLLIVNESQKNIDLKDEAVALKKLLKPKIVKVKENKEKRPRKENSVYTGNIFGFDEYKEFICYARRFKYYFSLDGDGYREENSSGNKYHVKTKIKDNQVYSKVGSDEFLTAYIVYELFGKNAPDNYKIEFIDGNSKNVDISNLKCIPLEPEPDNKPIGLYLQNLNSISYDGEEDTPIMTFASKKEAAEYFKIPIKRFNDIFNSIGEIKVKIKSSPYYHYLRLLDTKNS